MNKGSHRAPRKRRPWRGWLWLAVIGVVAGAEAQTCQSAADMEAAVRTGLETTARRYFDMAARGDWATLQQNAIPAVAANFGGIEAAVKDNQAAFAGGQVTVRPPFLLVADGSEGLARAEFLCGVFGPSGQTSNSAVFVLNNLAPGKYGVVILDAKGGQEARTLTVILQQLGTDWKLAGFYARSSQVNGHDGAWFAQHAREFKSKGQNRNAWLYFRQAIFLSAPADFMSTLSTDKLYDEAQAVQPNDLPLNGNVVDLSAGGTTYKLSAIFPLTVARELELVVKYQAADVSNSLQTFQANSGVIKALVAKFPEFRDAFDGVVARAVEPSGRDYGSMLPMKEIK
ncbi:MAG: hypothetical protein HY233_05995 [Acidobacteriales bacterium]|nr:hypothetical protein [Candidatus Koribacter versatilis]MBI3645496.1 hypothetical protein [Terriglobales bacterium]